MASEPCDPPKNSKMGFSNVKLNTSLADSLLPSTSSFFIGWPVKTVFAKLKYSVLGKEINILFAQFEAIRFDNPGTISDSCKNTGIIKIQAQNVTGKAPVPPFENTKFGLIAINRKKLCKKLSGIINKTSAMLASEK